MMLPNQAVYPSERTLAAVRALGTKVLPVNHLKVLESLVQQFYVILLIAALKN